MYQITVAASDPGLRSLLQAVLEEMGHTVGACPLNPDSSRTLRTAPPDLMLIEVGLGRAQPGWSLLDALRSDPELRALPVVAYSVDQHNLHDHRALLDECGAAALLQRMVVA